MVCWTKYTNSYIWSEAKRFASSQSIFGGASWYFVRTAVSAAIELGVLLLKTKRVWSRIWLPSLYSIVNFHLLILIIHSSLKESLCSNYELKISQHFISDWEGGSLEPVWWIYAEFIHHVFILIQSFTFSFILPHFYYILTLNFSFYSLLAMEFKTILCHCKIFLGLCGFQPLLLSTFLWCLSLF